MQASKINDNQLEQWRVDHVCIRVIRDYNEENDVVGWIAAWNEQSVLIRKRNKKVVQVARTYHYQPADHTRLWEVDEG